MLGWRKYKLKSRLPGEIVNNLRYADDTTLMAEREEELKSLLMKVKEESEKVGLKLNIQKTMIMESGPITSWEIDGETVEIVSDTSIYRCYINYSFLSFTEGKEHHIFSILDF